VSLTARQNKSRVFRCARARARLRIVEDASAAGKSKAEAAQLAGITIGGLDSLLRDRCGSKRWPIAPREPANDSPPVATGEMPRLALPCGRRRRESALHPGRAGKPRNGGTPQPGEM